MRRKAAHEIRRTPLDIPIDTRIAGGGGRIYQYACIQKICEEIVTGRRKMLVEMATGTGKTRTAAALLKRLFEANWTTRALFVVDRNHARDPGRRCLHRAPDASALLSGAANRPAISGRKARHHRHPANSGERIRQILARLFRSYRHRRMSPQHLRQMAARARSFRRDQDRPDCHALHHAGRAGYRRGGPCRRSATRCDSSRLTARPTATPWPRRSRTGTWCHTRSTAR